MVRLSDGIRKAIRRIQRRQPEGDTANSATAAGRRYGEFSDGSRRRYGEFSDGSRRRYGEFSDGSRRRYGEFLVALASPRLRLFGESPEQARALKGEGNQPLPREALDR